jgi:hypothetical protein
VRYEGDPKQGDEVQREKLIQSLRKHARKNDIAFDLQKNRGNGAHYRVRVGGRITTIQSGDLTPFQLRRICEQLGIDPANL